MPNHMKFCSCGTCRRGLRRKKRCKDMVAAIVRRQRHQAKANLKNNQEPERVVSVPYTW